MEKPDWNRANCSGMNTELFFLPIKELLKEGLSYRSLRRVCFACPIWRECLAWASENEAYGFWGGFSEEERKNIYESKPPRSHKQLDTDLRDCGVTRDEATRIIRSNKRKFYYSGALYK